MVRRIALWVKGHPKSSIALALIVAFILFQILKPAQRSYEYVAATVDQGNVQRRVTAAGKLRALNTIKVGAEVSGQITKVYVDFNSPVRAGQILAEIDPTRLRARVEQGRAQVMLAQSNLAQAEASIARTQSEIIIQEREFGRRKQLADRGFLSQSALDVAMSALAVARASVRTSNAQAASARAQIAQANAELSSAQLDLSRTTIVAPTAGVIINKLVEPGTTVAASFQTPNLFEIAADTTRMQVEATVDEADIGQIREGQAVRFTVDSYPNEAFSASVRQIRKAATETQNVVSYLVILDVANPDGKLLPGMTANVDIVTGERQRVTRIPTIAMRFRPRKADMPKTEDANKSKEGAPPATTQTVFVAGADPYKPVRRAVTIGLEGEDFVEIVKGLSPGEKIMVRVKTIKKASPDPDVVDGNDDDSSDDNSTE
jgi:HlyD family secretion protein